MTNESILISEVIPATPQRIFSAWMDSAEHSAFTGDEAIVVAEVGGEHQSAGGYIKGRTLELNEGSRIVQSWRTTEFPAESPDSRVEITLEPTLGGTLVTLLHTDIPVGQGDRYRQGWNEYYLSRLKTYFADSEPTLETRAEPGAEIEVDDVDVESEIVELDPSTVNEAPTRVMSQSARSKKPAMAAAKSPARKPAMAAKAKAPVKAAAKAAAKKLGKEAGDQGQGAGHESGGRQGGEQEAGAPRHRSEEHQEGRGQGQARQGREHEGGRAQAGQGGEQVGQEAAEGRRRRRRRRPARRRAHRRHARDAADVTPARGGSRRRAVVAGRRLSQPPAFFARGDRRAPDARRCAGDVLARRRDVGAPDRGRHPQRLDRLGEGALSRRPAARAGRRQRRARRRLVEPVAVGHRGAAAARRQHLSPGDRVEPPRAGRGGLGPGERGPLSRDAAVAGGGAHPADGHALSFHAADLGRRSRRLGVVGRAGGLRGLRGARRRGVRRLGRPVVHDQRAQRLRRQGLPGGAVAARREGPAARRRGAARADEGPRAGHAGPAPRGRRRCRR